ncbi:ankyrin-1 [Elysia marginata]|uniref:Ankyrin-1 n=1 Tax=Elysia marginata TaxID=1093978 RepID=A0AAV4FZK6_9GAST|nr:ankyrin-1 [Elysia marginata]
MSSGNNSLDSLAAFLSLCQTTVGENEEETKNALANRAQQMVKVLKLDLSRYRDLIVDGRHPLVEACRTGNIRIVEMFINHGASLNFVDLDGRTPLYAAIIGRNCSLADIRQLLHWGADVNLHKDGKLPLFASLYCMGTDVSRLLICEGADVNNVVLTCFCFIESVFALNTTLVMVMSGFQLRQFDDLPAMVSLALEIVLAGLLPKTFYLSSGKRITTRSSNSGQRHMMEEENLMSAELAMLWRLQHLCLCLGFRVDRAGVATAIADIREQLQLERYHVPSDEKLIALADDSVAEVSNFLKKFQLFSAFENRQEQSREEESEAIQPHNQGSAFRESMNTTQQTSVASDFSNLAEDSTNSTLSPQSNRVNILNNKLSQLLWMQHFQASPLPLTYLARMRIRAHLSQPSISKGNHIEKTINFLPIPRLFRDFLTLKDYRKSINALL